MTHLDQGTLVALRDADPVNPVAAEHLGRCVSCANDLDDARNRSQLVTEALTSLDEPVDVLGAKAAVRRRLDERRAAAPRRAWWRGHAGRAAALLVLTAGAASALPWSPVRSWWVDSQEPASTATEPLEPTGPGAPSQESPASISVAVADGRIAVVVRDAAPGTTIEVAWIDRPTARVSAPAGSGFTYADGRAEVDAAPGPIRVELPRTGTATLEVGGRVFLERAGERLDLPGPVVERTDAGIRFVIPTV